VLHARQDARQDTHSQAPPAGHTQAPPAGHTQPGATGRSHTARRHRQVTHRRHRQVTHSQAPPAGHTQAPPAGHTQPGATDRTHTARRHRQVTHRRHRQDTHSQAPPPSPLPSFANWWPFDRSTHHSRSSSHRQNLVGLAIAIDLSALTRSLTLQASIEESNLDAHKTDDYRVTATAPPQRRTTAVRPTPASEPPSGAGG
jgi:hypothetical protein